MKKTKKLLTVFAAVSVALMLPLQTMAAVDLNAKYDISTNQIQGWPAGPDITSDTGILMDADTGVVLYNKGGDEQRYPASITKIMTLLVAVENSTMDEKVIASARNIPGVLTTPATQLSVYDIINAKALVIDKAALATIEEVFA